MAVLMRREGVRVIECADMKLGEGDAGIVRLEREGCPAVPAKSPLC